MIAGLNPWISMWSRPRDTIRAIAFNQPSYGVYLLAIIYTLQSFFFYANWWSLGIRTSYALYLAIGIAVSPIVGFCWLHVTGAFFYLLGRLFNGVATIRQLRAVVAWSAIPYMITLFMWLLLLFGSPEYVFIQDAGPYSSVFIIFITLIVKAWSLVLLVQSLREVQGFSLKTALLNIFIIWLLAWVFFFFAVVLIRPIVI